MPKPRSRLSAKGLVIPKGIYHAVIADGMREVGQYQINKDAIAVRWDTIMDGKKQFIIEYPPYPYTQPVIEWAKGMRPIIKARFLAGDGMAS